MAWLVGQEPKKDRIEQTELRKTEEEICGWIFGMSIK